MDLELFSEIIAPYGLNIRSFEEKASRIIIHKATGLKFVCLDVGANAWLYAHENYTSYECAWPMLRILHEYESNPRMDISARIKEIYMKDPKRYLGYYADLGFKQKYGVPLDEFQISLHRNEYAPTTYAQLIHKETGYKFTERGSLTWRCFSCEYREDSDISACACFGAEVAAKGAMNTLRELRKAKKRVRKVADLRDEAAKLRDIIAKLSVLPYGPAYIEAKRHFESQ